MSDLRVHLRARQVEAHRTPGDARGGGGEDLVRPHEALAAETAARVRRDLIHVGRGDPQRRRHDRQRAEAVLGRVPERQLVPLPSCHRARCLHRIVVADRLVVALADRDGGARQSGARVALPLLGRLGSLRRRLDLALAGHERRLRRRRDADQRGCLLRRFKRLGEHQRDGLALPFDPIVLHR